MKKLSTSQWFGLMVFFAFAGMISFFQIDSYWADTKNLNGVFWVCGIVGTLLAAFCLKNVAKAGSSNDSGS